MHRNRVNNLSVTVNQTLNLLENNNIKNHETSH
jgi:hypothetical protein